MNLHKPAVEKVFDAALQFKAPGERAAYLQGACGDDVELRQQVEGLLHAHEHGGSFLDQPPAQVTIKTIAVTEAMLQLGEGEGDTIGRYKLLQKLGEGGFGSVYMAEQHEPVRRKVALKIIKLGMDTREMVARFEAERQALALMDHPNIAQVYDGGAAPNGRPYFVMELIKGVPITDYCDAKNLSPDERIQLFSKVCQAAQHAHQKGIIHRDLKPRNVLVTECDGEAVPKVIDFGVAKAIGSPLTEKTLFTRFEQMIGTPVYMSPEQTGLGSLDLDTRTDIYSLGVLLYELLTGTTPLEREMFEHAAVDEMRRMIRETEPPKPSTRLRDMGKKLTEVARTRSTDPAALTRLLHGDLDWVIMKSLEKDRKRRYGTANELADDLQRHLNHEPVVARPPSKIYLFQKFVRRNRFLVGGVSIVVLALVLGSALATWRFLEEKKARLKAEQISQFLKDMLGGVAPSVALGRDTTMLREILDKTARRIDKDLKNQPQVEAELAATLAEVYWELGDFANAEQLLQRTVQLLKKSFGDKNPAVAQALTDLGVVLRMQNKLPEAEKIHREILALRTKLFGVRNEDVAESYNDLGAVLYAEENLAEAERCYRQALDISRKLGNQEKLEFLSLNNLALALADQRKLPEAETNYREALVLLKKVSTNETPDMAGVLNNFAFVLAEEKKLPEAEQAHRRALELRMRFFPSEHPDIAQSMNNLAMVLRDERKLDEAEDLCRRALAMRKKLSGDKDDADVAQSIFNLASVLCDAHKFPEAERWFHECLSIRERILPDSWKTFNTRSALGACLADQQRYSEAEKFLVDGYAGMKKRREMIPVENVPRMKKALECLIRVYQATGHLDKVSELDTELENLKEKAAK
jgi:serine/threonine protein kinase/tetratricopeptide (TPR) repeat protein